MKYLEDLIIEASEVNERFEESKELISVISKSTKLEEIVYKEVIKKYDITISSIIILEDFLRDLFECSSEDEIVNFLIRSKN